MKKLAAIALFMALIVPAFASTDPFFILEKNKMYLDSELSYTNNYMGIDGGKYWQLKETFKFGVADNIELYGSLGFGRFKLNNYKETGLIDPEFGVKYRVSDSIADKFIFDVSAYFGPSLFDSPLDNNADGAAKGTSDFGVKGLFGKQGNEFSDPWTLGGFAAIDFIGSSDTTKSATDLHFGGVGKYYLDDVNSIDGEASINFLEKRNRDGENDTSLRFAGGYSRVLTDSLFLTGSLGFATHNAKGAKGEIFLGARLRWLF